GLCSVMNIALPGVEIVGTAINVLFGCILLFTPGTQGPNKFDGDSFKDQRSNRTAYQYKTKANRKFKTWIQKSF
ncbi:MAG: hypothetical protein B7Y73_03925, partial [Acidocella sp. 35-58-6]